MRGLQNENDASKRKIRFGIVSLLQDNYKLAEVTVRAKMFQQTSDGILVNVSGTDLGKLGYAPDVLEHLPFVIQRTMDMK